MMRRLTPFALLLLSVAGAASDLAVLRNGFSIPHESRMQVGETTRLFTSKDRAGFVDVPTSAIDRFEKIERFETDDSIPANAPATAIQSSSPQSVTQAIRSASHRYKLDPDFVSSVVSAESGFNPLARSRKGAQGLMQLMPGTASQLGVNDVLDPAKNADGGTRYLRGLLERYNFDVPKALAAYNAGPTRVDQHHGVPPYRETRRYVTRIINDYNRKKIAEGYVSKSANSSQSKQIQRRSQQKPTAGKTSAKTSPPMIKTTSQP
jgi:soluble lytic murein transglycosylase-like protein